MENISFRNVLQMDDDRVTLQTLKFVPRFDSNFDVSSFESMKKNVVRLNVCCIQILGSLL